MCNLTQVGWRPWRESRRCPRLRFCLRLQTLKSRWEYKRLWVEWHPRSPGRRGEEASTGSGDEEATMVGIWGTIPLEPSGRQQETHLSIPQLRGKDVGKGPPMSICYWLRAAFGDINYYRPSPKRKGSPRGGGRTPLAHPGMVNAASASSVLTNSSLQVRRVNICGPCFLSQLINSAVVAQPNT